MQANRSNAGALIVGTLLILFGLMALSGQLFRNIDWGSIWPLVVIGIGSLFLAAMATGGKQAAAFAIPGSIISGVGLVLFVQNMTGHWESMSYFWTLIIMFVGVGIYLMGRFGENENQRLSGLRVMKVGFILFIIFGAFFEMMFSPLNNLVFPVLLIVLGGYLLVGRSGLFGVRRIEEPSERTIPPAS